MQSQGNFSFVYSQLSKAFSSVDQKTQSLELLDSNYMGEEEFKLKLSQMSCEIPFLQIILEYGKLFSFFPTRELIQKKSQFGKEKHFDKLGAGGNATIFLCTDLTKNKYIAIKIMENFHINMLQNYIHECINQYNLIQTSKDYILNFEGYVYIKIKNQQASLYMPLELAEYSLYDYIQNNEITQEIYQYFFNFFIDILTLLHSNNYAHRDIKPQNILFVKGQGWKLADFGECIKYDKRLDLYRIQGTVAFLPSEIREKIKQNKEIKQDLYKNDVYAVICSLVMLKNPKFKSKELIEYMASQKLEQQLLQLILTVNQEQSMNQLQKLKTTCQKLNMEVFIPNQNLQNNQIDFEFDFEEKMRSYYFVGLFLDQDFISSLDNELKKKSSDPHRYQKLMLNIILFHPFQIWQLKNIELNELNHQQILNKLSFYFDDPYAYCFYMISYLTDIFSLIIFASQRKDLALLRGLTDYCIRNGHFRQVDELLQIFGIVQQYDFNSDDYFSYNYHYQRIHGKTLILDSNISIFDRDPLTDHKTLLTQLKEATLKDIRLINPDFPGKQNLIQLLQPLQECTQKDQTSQNIVFKHIIQSLGFSEIKLGQTWPGLVDAINLQLILGGALLYKPFIFGIIIGLEKLFLYYELFEGSLNLLHHFLTFMQYTYTIICQYIISRIQNYILKCNLHKYHVGENFIKKNIYLDLVKTKNYQQIAMQQLIQMSKNILFYNLIIEQQKKQQSKIHLNSQNYLYYCLEEIIKRKNMIIYNDVVIFTNAKQYAVVLGFIESEFPKYLNLAILVICKYICSTAIDQRLITLNLHKKKLILELDPVLLKFYINCKQYHRIKQLIILWK